VSGDFNGDGYSDLAIGIRQDNVAGLGTGGGVAVLYGSTLGLETDSANEFNQDTPGVPDEGETGDDFGAALAAGDFNGDTFADLAIGAPGESLNNIANAGAVTVLYGSPSGLSQDEVEQWTQNSPGILDRAEVGDKFGAALAASYCTIPCSGISDTLIVGVPFENVGEIGGTYRFAERWTLDAGYRYTRAKYAQAPGEPKSNFVFVSIGYNWPGASLTDWVGAPAAIQGVPGAGPLSLPESGSGALRPSTISVVPGSAERSPFDQYSVP
jgi:hypothetical protein